MKIVFVAANFPPVVDGVGDYTFRLSEEFARNGHQVYVICPRKEEIIANQPYLSLSSIQVLPIIDRWDRQAGEIILKNITELQPDWVIPQYVPHAFDYYGVPFWFGGMIAAIKKSGHKVAVTFHEVFIDFEWNKPKYWPVAISQRFIVARIAGLADRLIVSIDRVRKQLARFDEKMTRIPIGSNIFTCSIPAEAIRDKRNQIAPNGEFILTSFGIRDQLALIRLTAALKQEKHPVKLLLLGKLPAHLREQINQETDRQQVTDSVVLPGFLTSEALYLHLRCADVFVLLEENRGGLTTKSGSLAAAYAAELPIVGTKGHMTDSFFRDGENVLFTNASDTRAMVSTFKKLMRNEDGLLDTLKEGSRKTYYNALSWENIYEKYIKHLN